MNTTRPPAVADMFYPGDAATLRKTVTSMLAQARDFPLHPKALIVPHAGYVYSGPVAATAYRLLRERREIRRVVLLGPSHRVALRGIAASGAAAFATPLGSISIDQEAMLLLAQNALVSRMDEAHRLEHSLEVHLPFLQLSLPLPFSLVPLVVGECAAADVATVLETLWGGAETLIVVSSDLSHYHDYATARRLDQATSQAIENLRYEAIGYDDACGRNPVRGLLLLARNKGMQCSTLDLRNSGDTAGPRDQVVGYGAYVLQ